MRLSALLVSALLPAAAALAGPLSARRAFRASPIVAKAAAARFEICQNKYCRKKGAASTLRYFQELSEGVDGLEVVVADMSHTEHGCFDECTMGPNVRFDGEPRTDSGRVVNGVKGAAAIAELLGVDVPEGYK